MAAGAVVAAAALGVPQPAAAAPNHSIVGDTPAPPSSPATAVTLITGTQVLVSTAADGTPSAVVKSSSDHYSRVVGEDLYVIPVEAQSALAADRLDIELFNVTGLIEQGYDDASSETLPLIVEGSVPRTRGAASLAVEANLQSIDATAVSVEKDRLRATYPQLLGTNARSASTVGKVWLDAKVESSAMELDPATGVGQTGAPKAWRLGFDGTGTKVAVLDTGYDPEHPDLAGRVIAAQDFTGQGDPADRDGHGTHVASTIAGTGAADASKVGMAPEAGLLVGKVLGFGGGQTSWIVGGMEWAVAQGADVVNMSLGSSQPTDCTDPMAQAAAALSEQAKTLFVVAAGNSGARETVSSPGCVEGVLTVGAVDSEGETAAFSSRGSVLGDHRVKPDIAAPGVAIVGAQNNSPGGIHYTAMSGTSMATPHVAGAAALVRQAHPDWTAQQVRAALVAGVKDDAEDTVYDQGAGELWTPDAIRSPVTSEVSVHVASFDWPHGRDERVSDEITYTNTSGRAVTLHLGVEDLTGADGRSMPSRALRLVDDKVTVPAHGTAAVDVVARGDLGDLRDTAYGEIGGRIVAEGRGAARHVQVTTAVGFWLEPETVSLTVKSIDRNGAAATSGFLDITDMHQPARAVAFFDGEDLTTRVRVGSFFVSAFIRTTSPDGTSSYAYVGEPEAQVTKDTTLTLDAREAHEVTVAANRPVKIRSGSLGVQRTWDDRWVVGNSLFAASDPTFYAAPSGRADNGSFTFGTYLRAYDPAVALPDSGYVYNLAFTDEDRVSADQSHRISDRQLASVTENWHAQRRAGWAPEDWTRVVMDNGTGPFFTSSSARVAAPHIRTAYYTPGVAWQQLASGSGFRSMPETWFDPVRTYRRGEHRTTDWFKLPSITGMAVNPDGSPARIAERQGSLVGFAFPVWKDSVEGRVGAGGFADIGNMQVYRDGELVDTSSFPAGQFEVGEEDSRLRVVVNQFRFQRSQVWELGRATISRFEFPTSRPDGDAVQALPVALPRYDAPVDSLNTAPATAAFPVSVTLQGQDGYDPGAIRSFAAKVSFDDIDQTDVASGARPVESYDWTDVPVVRRNGHWVALVDNTAAAGGVASLWITAEDSHGTKTEQFTIGLYGVH
jgi:subtilisin family serine protease